MYKILWCYLTNSNPIRIDRGLMATADGTADGTVFWFIADYSTQKMSCYSITEEERKILERDHSEYAVMGGFPENFEDPFSEALEGLNIMIYEIEPSTFHKDKICEKIISFSEIESIEINKNFVSF